mgnify:FL=1
MALKSFESTQADLWEFYNGLLLSPDVERIRKLLVRYDIFKMSLKVPGDILECGVFKGVGVMYWLKLLAIFAPAAMKKVVGFDTFATFADDLLPYEKKTAGDFTNETAFEGVDPNDILEIATRAGFKDRLELIAGDIKKTAQQYVQDNPGFRISLLHLDLDTYNGTTATLENFYELVSPGGIILLDEYGMRGWGESDAVDKFFKGRPVEIRVVEHSYKPSAYIIKQG